MLADDHLVDEGQMMRTISLVRMPPEVMLIIEYPSRVRYENQVGEGDDGKRSMEGVLVPIGLELEAMEQIRACSYSSDLPGITSAIADVLDELLASDRRVEFLRVDPTRRGESREAWIYVVINSPERSERRTHGIRTNLDYLGSMYGFGTVRGVLTWRQVRY